jgi:SAM-dependent MidA family methyltransferase
LLARTQGVWHERGVSLSDAGQGFIWQDRVTDMRPPLEIEGPHDYLTEIHPQAEAFIRTLADPDPLADVGLKDITAHVNFTGIALAGQEAGLGVLGYCTQARFLMNSGLLDLLAQADLKERVNAQKLILEHEMGELFKVIGFYKGEPWEAIGFAQGDRTHTL